MRRRDLIYLLGGAAAAASPLAARAQQQAVPVIGYLNSLAPGAYRPRLAAFHKGLAETGYVEGRNVTIEYRWAEGRYENLPAMAAELTQLHVGVIAATGGNAPAFAARAASTTVPIVFAVDADPVEIGLVRSINRPEANLTGVNFLLGALAAKRFQLLRETVPNAGAVGILVNPDAVAEVPEVRAAAETLGHKLLMVKASSEREIDTAFAGLVRERVGALIVASDVFFFGRREQIAALAARHAIPAIYTVREFPEAGGLMSYGTSVDDAQRLAGVYVGRILKGAKPADLPVQQAVKTDFVINLKAAKALGLELPPTLIATADEVIE
jgi:ABC-type uncharacterized transport system substrate-binding protein